MDNPEVIIQIAAIGLAVLSIAQKVVDGWHTAKENERAIIGQLEMTTKDYIETMQESLELQEDRKTLQEQLVRTNEKLIEAQKEVYKLRQQLQVDIDNE